jgi:hypothetical protein
VCSASALQTVALKGGAREDSVTDFGQEFEKRVQAAQQAYRQWREELGRQKTERIRRTGEMTMYARQRFIEAAQAVPTDLVKFVKGRAQAGLEFELVWTATGPRRRLAIRTDHENGRLWWAWGLQPPTDWVEADVIKLSREQIDELIYALADQEKWQSGQVPDVGLPGTASN